MANLTAFLGYFISYLILFLVFVAIAVLACTIGIRWRKSKDARAALAEGSGPEGGAD